ncbi:Soluble lytic murein transglycosylase [Malonomonas rubra DSM 5091]|uniref:Soluble lytic murein transglycosylase n=1 Tax=Malonomonas rubra DSM 5091 TaxID=1122189 RepID=A0A1M6I0S9_MALRU|nr:lytic transglycosylase domain-containing protein [Malonomonas rubra]SHJ28015.1 Soluble lytic murein transglycosylase [Malonomonas rubra DSM 5091]
MSIDPLQSLLPSTQLKPLNQVGRDETTNTGFAELLDAAGQVKAGVAKAQELMELAQMQLLQGLFDTKEEAGKNDDLLSRLSTAGFSLRAAPQVQQADRVYRQLQPSLQNPPERAEIESMIERVAQQVSLAPELIRSVVAAESNFQPQAISPVGAQGLMQLMPATAAELGVEDSFDPQQNLLGGSRYLKQLLDKYDGDLDKALAAYNWGQGNVDRKGLQQMPEETRDYLVKVKAGLSTG